MKWKPPFAVLLGLLVVGVTAGIGTAKDSPQKKDVTRGAVSLDRIPTLSPEQAEKLLKEGELVLVDPHGLKALKDAGLLPYIIKFGNDTIYAVKILPKGRFFIYAAPKEYVAKDIEKFKKEALAELRMTQFVKYTVPVESPLNYSWKVRSNGKVISNFSTQSVSTSTNAYLEGKIVWTSGDNWAPMVD